MKLSDEAAAGFCARPDPAVRAALLYGDPDLVAERRAVLTGAYLGADRAAGEVERVTADALRRDAAALDAALRSRGFFATRRVVILEDAGDGLADAVEAALPASGPDAALIVCAGSLRAGGALRRLFEGARGAAALACWGRTPDRGAIAARLDALGAPAPDAEGMAALEGLADGLERGAFWTELDKLALYKGREAGPITAADVAASGPSTIGSALDAALDAVAGGKPGAVRAALARLAAQGVDDDAVAAAAVRRFRSLAAAAALMEAESLGAEAALGRLRPPIRFPRAKPLALTLARWRRREIEEALAALCDLHATARAAGASAHRRAMVERALIRVAMTAGR